MVSIFSFSLSLSLLFFLGSNFPPAVLVILSSSHDEVCVGGIGRTTSVVAFGWVVVGSIPAAMVKKSWTWVKIVVVKNKTVIRPSLAKTGS